MATIPPKIKATAVATNRFVNRFRWKVLPNSWITYRCRRVAESSVVAAKLATRKVNVNCLKREEPQENVADARQVVKVRQGIESELARRLVKTVKDTKVKVQVAVQGDQLRVTGKKRDILQGVINLLKEEKVDMPLQFINFRD